MGLNITAYRNRTSIRTITITDADGDNVVIAETDVVRVKIGRGGEVPLLDLDGVETTSNGSGCTNANPTTLTLDNDDMTMVAGIYDIEVMVVDDSDRDSPKQAENGVFTVLETQLGDVWLT